MAFRVSAPLASDSLGHGHTGGQKFTPDSQELENCQKKANHSGLSHHHNPLCGKGCAGRAGGCREQQAPVRVLDLKAARLLGLVCPIV